MRRTHQEWLPGVLIAAILVGPVEAGIIRADQLAGSKGNFEIAALTVESSFEVGDFSLFLSGYGLIGTDESVSPYKCESNPLLQLTASPAVLADPNFAYSTEELSFYELGRHEFQLDNAKASGALTLPEFFSGASWHQPLTRDNPPVNLADRLQLLDADTLHRMSTSELDSTSSIESVPPSWVNVSVADGVPVVDDYGFELLEPIARVLPTMSPIGEATGTYFAELISPTVHSIPSVGANHSNKVVSNEELTLRVADNNRIPWRPRQPTPVPVPIVNKAALTTASGREVVREILKEVHEEGVKIN